MTESFEKAAEIILAAKLTLALTGAGISVESGIPDFRSAEGLWSKFDPAEYATIECQNGVFGGRMKENVERIGGVAVMQQDRAQCIWEPCLTFPGMLMKQRCNTSLFLQCRIMSERL
jgi:hypothetical protein